MSNTNVWQLLLTFLLIAGAQFIAILLLLVIHVIAWLVRRKPEVYWGFGILGLLLIGAFFVVLGWMFGGWQLWDESVPPDFVDRTWVYASGFASFFLLFAAGVTFLHRKQFNLSLAAGFLGFCFEIAVTFVAPLIIGPTLLHFYWLCWQSYPSWFNRHPEYSYASFAFWTTYVAIWLVLTFFRPTLLHLWQSFRHQFATWKNSTLAD